MLRIVKCTLLAGLLTGVGCTPVEKRPETPKKAAVSKSKPAGDDVPVAVQKILPVDQVNEHNADAQAKIMLDNLSKEKGQLDRTESAKRE